MSPGVRAYSMDLRERVVAAVDAGLPQSQAAERFGVSLRSVERYLARRRVTGSLAATEQRHGPEPTVRRQLQAWVPGRPGPRRRRPCRRAPGAPVAIAPRAALVAAFVPPAAQPVSLASMSRAIAG